MTAARTGRVVLDKAERAISEIAAGRRDVEVASAAPDQDVRAGA